MKLITTNICKTSDIGINNNLFGGVMLSWLDEAGAIMSNALCNTPNMVTVKFDEVLFKEPVKVGNHIKMYGKMCYVGKTSISLYIDARRKSFESNAPETVVCSTNITFVRIGKDGHSKPLDDKIRKVLINQLS